MRVMLGACAVAVVGMMAGTAVAEEGGLDFYIAGRLIPTLSNVDDISVNPSTDIRLRDDEIEFVATGGAALGYDFSNQAVPIRVEVEYTYGYHADFETESTNGFGNGAIAYDNSTTHHAVFLDAHYVLETATRYRPFIGGGVGWVRNIGDFDRVNLNTRMFENQETETDNFGWRVGVGTLIRINKDFTGEIGYRYSDLGEIESGAFSTGDSVQFDRRFSHDFVFGLLYSF